MTSLAISLAPICFLLQEPRPQVQLPDDGREPPAAAESAAQESRFDTAQLEQIVAPIALYPDVLLSQVLMASTYPLEIVEASRFVKANPKLAGAELEEALKAKDWDPSVKAMCGFPDLLERMNENLDWMRDLGDAFLAQEAELMDVVQQMRRTASDAGSLKSTKEQSVREDGDTIVIEPASPDVIYVPVYYPSYVYGGWGYPWWYYPRLYVGPPVGGPYFYFHTGFAWGPWWPWMWGRCNWSRGHSHVDVDVHVHNDFVTRTSSQPRHVFVTPKDGRDGGRTSWQHDPSHRRGVNYRDPVVRRRVQSDAPARPDRGFVRPTRPPSDDLRGRTRTPRDGDARTPRTQPPPQPPRSRTDDVSPTTPPRTRTDDVRPTSPRSRMLDGARDPSFDRAARERGSRSLRSYWQRQGGRTPPRSNPPRASSTRPRGGP